MTAAEVAGVFAAWPQQETYGKKMNSLERLKEATEHPGSYINGPDIALALKVIEAAMQQAEGVFGDGVCDALFAALAALTEEKP